MTALGGVAPAVMEHVVFRATEDLTRPRDLFEGYLVPGEPQRLTEAAFDFWLAKRGLAGLERLSVAVLVVQERVTADGNLLDCVLEFRRGARDGPYHGSPARITFSGAAQIIRFFQATPEGRLTEFAPTPYAVDVLQPGDSPGTASRRDAEQSAVAAYFGDGVRVVAARPPTVIEAMVGFTSVLHIVRADGQDAACGILWHGPAVVPLQAAFPRFDVAPQLTAGQQVACDALLAEHGLLACEVRRIGPGVAMLARRQGGTELFLLQFDEGVPRLNRYVPGQPARITDAQAQWVRYIETYERFKVLDAYQDGVSDTLIVLTTGPEETFWRHSVDADGVEAWRIADTGTIFSTSPEEGHEPGGGSAAEACAAQEPDPQPFGQEVETRFPTLGYDIDEAARCLSLGRTTAAVFHCMRIIEQGLRAYANWQGSEDLLVSGERRWPALMRWVGREPGTATLIATLEAVRRAWRGMALQVASKYTEAEATRIYDRTEHFMRCLAGLCDETGEPVDDPERAGPRTS
jgi:hypothetical protein